MTEEADMRLDSSSRRLVQLLVLAIAVTLAGFAGFGWSIVGLRKEFQGVAYEELYLQQLTASIVQQDKSLALLVRVAVETQEPRWIEAYRDLEPVLAGAVATAVALAPEAFAGVDPNAPQGQVTARLSLEHAALDAVLAGDLPSAREALDSDRYQALRSLHDTEVAALADAVDARVTARLAAFARRIAQTAGLLASVVAVVLLTWSVILRRVLSHLRERIRALSRVAQARDELELRVEERTASLRVEMQRRQELQSRLLDASRAAGKAEVATSVLHNVGNVLNSVNVSTEVISKTVATLPARDLQRAVGMLEDNLTDVEDYLHKHEQGRHLPTFLRSATDRLAALQTSAVEELKRVRDHLEHIKRVVSLQQDNAGHRSVLESVSPGQLADEALSLASSKLRSVEVERRIEELPAGAWPRHDILQILVNLLTNAAESCAEEGASGTRVTITAGVSTEFSGGIRFEVTDQGIGIEEKHLQTVFGYGFTLKPGGHGFGLHGAATSTTAMGGRLSAQSDGIGHGACFVLELPPQGPAPEAPPSPEGGPPK